MKLTAIEHVEDKWGGGFWFTCQKDGFAPFRPNQARHATREQADAEAANYLSHEAALEAARAANDAGDGLSRAAYEAGCAARGVAPAADAGVAEAGRSRPSEPGYYPPGLTALLLAQGRLVRLRAEAASARRRAEPLPLDPDEKLCKTCRRWQPVDQFTTIGGGICDDCA